MSKRIHRPEQDRLVFEVLRLIREMSPADVAKRASYGRGMGRVSAQTIRKWRLPVKDGGTRYPQAITLQAVARAAGCELRFVRTNQPLD